MAEKKTPDWERIEVEYCAGVLSVRELATEHGISHTAINKKAKSNGWTRNLEAKIKARADALVSKAEVSSKVSNERAINEREVIEAGAQAIANVKLAHRSSIGRYKNLVAKLLTELETQTDDLSLYEQLGDLMYKPDEKGLDKLNEIYRKVIGLPQRTKVIVDLANTLKTLIALERESYNIDGAREDVKPAQTFDDNTAAARMAAIMANAKARKPASDE